MLKHLLTRSLLASSLLASSVFVVPAVLAIPIYGKHSTEQVTEISYHRSDWLLVNSKNSVTLKWNCPSNAYIISGGFETRGVEGNSTNGFTVINSFPSNARQWTLGLRNQDDIARDVRIYAVCAE